MNRTQWSELPEPMLPRGHAQRVEMGVDHSCSSAPNTDISIGIGWRSETMQFSTEKANKKSSVIIQILKKLRHTWYQ